MALDDAPDRSIFGEDEHAPDDSRTPTEPLPPQGGREAFLDVEHSVHLLHRADRALTSPTASASAGRYPARMSIEPRSPNSEKLTSAAVSQPRFLRTRN